MPTIVSVFGVEPFRIGGTETFARELSLQLGQRGWTSVLCFQSAPPEEVRRFLDLPNVTIEVLAGSESLSLKAAKGLGRILAQYHPEIVHLHFVGFLGLYPWLARLRSVKKVFFTDHMSRPAGYVAHRAPFWKRVLARIMNRPITKVICVSTYGYRCITGLDLLPNARYGLVYNGVDLSRVSPDPRRAAEFRRRHSIPTDRTVVLQVSWIIPEKGIPELLQTARLVLSKTDTVQFVIVGDGAYLELYMKDAQAMGLGDHVTWTGLVQDPFGEGVYDAADIICQLSHWEEVFGWMIAEGMAYSKPVVATRVGGIPELVVDQVTGFLVKPGDMKMMADTVLRLLADRDLRESLGRAGRLRASEKFCLQQNVKQLVELYGIGSQMKPNDEINSGFGGSATY